MIGKPSQALRSAFSFCLFLVAASMVLVVIQPQKARATYEQANVQCPPGGKIGQPCKDTTNGYTTPGTCAFVYVCKASSTSGPTPPKCTDGCPTGRPYPSFTPTPKRIPAATSTNIEGSSVSEVEAGVLGAAFNSEGTEIAKSVNLEDLSAAANAKLLEVLDAKEEDGYLGYTPESFDVKTSSLFAALAQGAVMLRPGAPLQESTGYHRPSLRLAYTSESGFFGGAPEGGGGGGGTQSDVEALKASVSDQFWFFPRYLALAVFNAVRALGSVLLADFGVAANHWHEALTDFGIAFRSLIMGIKLLIQLLVAWIASSTPLSS